MSCRTRPLILVTPALKGFRRDRRRALWGAAQSFFMGAGNLLLAYCAWFGVFAVSTTAQAVIVGVNVGVAGFEFGSCLYVVVRLLCAGRLP